MNHFISLEEAAQMTARYRKNRNPILAATYQGQNILPICESFDRAAFDTLLSKPGCAGLRIYYGMDEELKVHAIIVGVNADNEDMLTTATTLSAATTEEEDEIVERGTRCPDICPPSSELNTDQP